MAYFGQDPLVALIRGYRRFLSGRGPLRAITCTFGKTESCSAYALRVVKDARNVPEAVRLIRARLCRCRQASLYRFADGWGWGDIYDNHQNGSLYVALKNAKEAPSTIGSVLWTAALAARHRGEEHAVRSYAHQAKQTGGPGAYVVIRDGNNWHRFLYRRLMVRMACAIGLLLAALLLPLFLSLPCLAAAFLCLMASVQDHRRQQARFEMQTAANSFHVLREALASAKG